MVGRDTTEESFRSVQAEPVEAASVEVPALDSARAERQFTSGAQACSKSVFLLALLLFAACKDTGADQYVTAKARYDALITEGVRPSDPRFDEVRTQLEAIPSSSAKYATAHKLLESLQAARQTSVRAPLAVAPSQHTNLPPNVVEQLQRCAQLARAAGLDGGLDTAALKALDACRAEAERMDVAHHEAEAPPLPTPQRVEPPPP